MSADWIPVGSLGVISSVVAWLVAWRVSAARSEGRSDAQHDAEDAHGREQLHEGEAAVTLSARLAGGPGALSKPPHWRLPAGHEAIGPVVGA